LNDLAPATGYLGGLDAESACRLIGAAADVALVVDGAGVIRDVSLGSDEMSGEGFGKWIGQPWIETVTVESRPKVEALLHEAGASATGKRRHVNHMSSRGADVPVLYSAVQVGEEGLVVAFGRDLRANASLQQRLLDAQQSMERDYWRLRNVETRYRLLFQMSSEAVLVVDGASLKVLEANPAASALLGKSTKQIVGKPFEDGFDGESQQLIQTLLAAVRAAGRADEVRVRVEAGQREFLVSASTFRQDNATFFLIRLSPVKTDPAGPVDLTSIPRVVESIPDGFVVTDIEGRVLTANRSFIDLAELAAEAQVRGQPLERWLGRSGVEFNVLSSSLRQHGSVRLFASVLRGEHGAIADVEISAVSAPNSDPPCFGFIIRDIGRRPAADARATAGLPKSPTQLIELVGRVSLKELVRESTDLIEQLCIEAALELTRNNRASAADLLGLSRQSLYVKLRRYGLGDLGTEAENPALT
jgi:transcriptional regulator PpsR